LLPELRSARHLRRLQTRPAARQPLQPGPLCPAAAWPARPSEASAPRSVQPCT
jgi:hypothetical protein